MRSSLLLFCWLLWAVAASAQPAPSPPPTPDAAEVDFTYQIRIPLRDGVSLTATVYRPKGQTTPAPCVFTLTPYTRQTYHDRGLYFAARGVPFLTVDSRGRGDSGGVFHSSLQEAHDGFDVVEWLAKQPYCTGKVSMWGGSYAGYDQWATAKERPPHLATIVPVAAPYMSVDFPLRGGIMDLYILQWLTYTAGHALQSTVFGDSELWTAIGLDRYRRHAALRDYPAALGGDQPQLREWIAHREDEAYWAPYNATEAQLRALDIPILTITGAYDADQLGAMEWYRRAMAAASPEQRARMFLVIGPWDHPGTRTPKATFGGLSFGPASLVDLPKLHLDWYAWTMAGGPKPGFLRKPVAYYVAGAETWRYADSLDGVTAESRPYYLGSTGEANDALHSGALDPGRPSGGSDRYRYDPLDTAPGEAEATQVEDPNPYLSEASVTAMAGKQFVYHTAPFAKDTEISGFFRLKAWIALDQPDTDFNIDVYALDPAGRSIWLTGDRLRARYRSGKFTPRLVSVQTPLLYDFTGFTFASRLMPAGSRLRLVIGPVNSLGVEKNYNSGGKVEDETGADARTVTVTLAHDRAHPSALFVPIGQPR